MTEEQLAIRAGAGDEQAFATLERQMAGLVFTIAQPFYGPGLEREDLVQAAMVGLWYACRRFDPEGGASWRTFASMCMRRNVITAVVAARRVKHRALHESLSLDAPVDEVDSFHELRAGKGVDPVEALLTGEQLNVVVRIVRDELSPVERAAAVGLMNGDTYSEIGEKLGYQVYERQNGERRCKTVDNALQRARRKVLEGLGEDVRRRPLGASA